MATPETPVGRGTGSTRGRGGKRAAAAKKPPRVKPHQILVPEAPRYSQVDPRPEEDDIAAARAVRALLTESYEHYSWKPPHVTMAPPDPSVANPIDTKIVNVVFQFKVQIAGLEINQPLPSYEPLLSGHVFSANLEQFPSNKITLTGMAGAPDLHLGEDESPRNQRGSKKSPDCTRVTLNVYGRCVVGTGAQSMEMVQLSVARFCAMLTQSYHRSVYWSDLRCHNVVATLDTFSYPNWRGQDGLRTGMTPHLNLTKANKAFNAASALDTNTFPALVVRIEQLSSEQGATEGGKSNKKGKKGNTTTYIIPRAGRIVQTGSKTIPSAIATANNFHDRILQYLIEVNGPLGSMASFHEQTTSARQAEAMSGLLKNFKVRWRVRGEKTWYETTAAGVSRHVQRGKRRRAAGPAEAGPADDAKASRRTRKRSRADAPESDQDHKRRRDVNGEPVAVPELDATGSQARQAVAEAEDDGLFSDEDDGLVDGQPGQADFWDFDDEGDGGGLAGDDDDDANSYDSAGELFHNKTNPSYISFAHPSHR